MIKKLITSTVLGLTLYLPIHAIQAAPNSFQARYAVSMKIKILSAKGEMVATLTQNNQSYNYQRNTNARSLLANGKINESVQGQRRGQQYLPKNYLRHQSDVKTKRDQMQFTSPTQVRGSYNNSAYQINVPNGTLDPVTTELRLMDDLAHNRPLNYRVTEKGQIKNYNFRRLGKEVIQVPAGKYTSEKVQLVQDGGKRVTTFWMAPELGYLPVRMLHTNGSNRFETRLTQYQAR